MSNYNQIIQKNENPIKVAQRRNIEAKQNSKFGIGLKMIQELTSGCCCC